MSSLKCCEGSQDGGVGRSGDRGGQDRSVERRFCGTMAFTHYSIMQKVEQFGSSVFSVTRGFSSKGGGRNARVSQPLHAVCLVFSFLFFFPLSADSLDSSPRALCPFTCLSPQDTESREGRKRKPLLQSRYI